jgi:hypothetical protein
MRAASLPAAAPGGSGRPNQFLGGLPLRTNPRVFRPSTAARISAESLETQHRGPLSFCPGRAGRVLGSLSVRASIAFVAWGRRNLVAAGSPGRQVEELGPATSRVSGSPSPASCYTRVRACIRVPRARRQSTPRLVAAPRRSCPHLIDQVPGSPSSDRFRRGPINARSSAIRRARGEGSASDRRGTRSSRAGPRPPGPERRTCPRQWRLDHSGGI